MFSKSVESDFRMVRTTGFTGWNGTEYESSQAIRNSVRLPEKHRSVALRIGRARPVPKLRVRDRPKYLRNFGHKPLMPQASRGKILSALSR